MSQKPIDQLRPLARSNQFLRRHLRCVTVVLLAASAAPAIEARAQDVVPLVCGEFVDRPLEPGATDRVRPVGVGDAATLFEITDSSQRIGALKLVDSGTGIETCGGTLSSPAGELPPRIISISDCLGSDKGRYTAGFHVVSEGEANCGQPLTCGGTPTAGLLEHIGETDAYQISVGETANVEIAASAPSAGTIDIRLRLYSPEGEFLEESCNGALATELPDAGTYTLLVSDCTSRAKGAYSVQWQQAPSCPTQPSANDTVYVLNSESGSVALVDPLAKQVTTVIPVTPGGTLDSFLQFAVSPNRAFTYVSFPETGTVSVIDNERKRTAGFLRLPEGTDAFHRNVAIHPLDGSIYAMSESVGGVVIFDPASRRVSSSFPIVDIHPEGGIAFHPNGTILFVATVACGSKPQACTPGIAVVDVESRSVVSTVVGLGERTEQIVFHPLGGFAYAVSPEKISVVDATTRGISATIPIANVADLAFDTVAHRAYASNGDGIAILDTTSHSAIGLLLDAPLGSWGIGLSPDGRFLYAVDSAIDFDPTRPNRKPALAIVDVQSTNIVARLPTFGARPTDVVVLSVPSGLCTGDADAEVKVTIGELVSSVNYAIDGCPTDPQAATASTARQGGH